MENLAQKFNLTKQQLITFSLFGLLLVSLPVTLYLARMVFKGPSLESQAGRKIPTNPPSDSFAQGPESSLEKQLKQTLSPTPTEEPTPEETANNNVSFGPTLNLKVTIEGRPKGHYATQAFIGIASGNVTKKPKYLLSFTTNIPKSGVFNGLSLAGLETGSTYTTYVKGAAQIDSAATLTLGPAVNLLNSGNALNLTSGDLNEDNTIDNIDYNLAKGLYGTTSSSSGWNERADFNLDGVINNFDLGIISKNLGKTGASGLWYSKASGSPGLLGIEASQTASPSGGDEPPDNNSNRNGYWIWIPPTD